MTTSSGTPRPIGFWMAVALVMGNMIGSGIFLLPSSLAPFGGGLTLAGWLVSAAGAVALALVFARLARLDPAAGGPYAYTRRAFGDFAGFFVAWGYWVSMWTSLGALAVAFVGYLDPFFPALVAIARHGGPGRRRRRLGAHRRQRRGRPFGRMGAGRDDLLKIVPLLAVGARGPVRVRSVAFRHCRQPASRSITGGVSATAALTLWAFLGPRSGDGPERRASTIPARTIPRATLVGTLIAAGIYILSTVGVMSLLPPDGLGRPRHPTRMRRVAGGRRGGAAGRARRGDLLLRRAERVGTPGGAAAAGRRARRPVPAPSSAGSRSAVRPSPAC